VKLHRNLLSAVTRLPNDDEKVIRRDVRLGTGSVVAARFENKGARISHLVLIDQLMLGADDVRPFCLDQLRKFGE